MEAMDLTLTELARLADDWPHRDALVRDAEDHLSRFPVPADADVQESARTARDLADLVTESAAFYEIDGNERDAMATEVARLLLGYAEPAA